ncbi:MAG: hypothetical protein IPK26_06650 [Planctomycetes bacterium]|nr:hypothetical protein [Planctomycetota bacterium]
MTTLNPPPVPQVTHPAPLPAPVKRDPSGTFAGIAALGGAFAGFVHHSYDPDLLATAIAVGITFFGAFLALLVLHAIFKMTLAVGRVAMPIALVLLLGCLLDWRWAEAAVDWLWTAGSHGLSAAGRAWSAAQAR